jgi:hypothetical protein
MVSGDQQFVSKRNLQCALGAVFLVVLLIEWGSHSLTFSHTEAGNRTTVAATEIPHDDPCRMLVHGPDGKQQNQSNLRHNVGPSGTFLNFIFESFSAMVTDDPVPGRAPTAALFRPPNPPFHPPEFS